MNKKDVDCFIDDDEVDCEELQEEESEGSRRQTTGGGAET